MACKCVFDLKKHKQYPRRVFIIQNGNIALLSGQNMLSVWDPKSEKLIGRLRCLSEIGAFTTLTNDKLAVVLRNGWIKVLNHYNNTLKTIKIQDKD